MNDPTKTRSPSTAKVLACRLEPELPKGPMLLLRSTSPDMRFISNNSTPLASRSLRRLA
ncbi:hypothetical protein D3C81_2193200 [compost metagenome]